MELLSNASTHASTTDHSSQQFPAPPHQSVRTVFPYTAFRCSSSARMRPFPASARGKLEQTVSSIEHGRGKLRIPCRPTFHLVPCAKVCTQSLVHMPFHSTQALGAIAVVEIARPPAHVLVERRHHIRERNRGSTASGQLGHACGRPLDGPAGRLYVRVDFPARASRAEAKGEPETVKPVLPGVDFPGFLLIEAQSQSLQHVAEDRPRRSHLPRTEHHQIISIPYEPGSESPSNFWTCPAPIHLMHVHVRQKRGDLRPGVYPSESLFPHSRASSRVPLPPPLTPLAIAS